MKLYTIFDNLAKVHVQVFPAVNDDVAKRYYAAFCSQNQVISPDCSLVRFGISLLDDCVSITQDGCSGHEEVMNFGQYLSLVSVASEDEKKGVRKNGKK